MRALPLAIGCCAQAADLPAVASTPGLDYIELPVATALMGGDGAFDQLAGSLRRSRLGARAANVFLPATLKVVGPGSSTEMLAEYTSTALERAQTLGIELLVFGSGGSRMVPAGFSRERALDQLEAAVRVVDQVASLHGITVALEPLHSDETNLLNSVGESAAFVRDRRLDSVRLVADLWHMECEREDLDALADAGDLVAHAHVAAAERRAPGQGPDRIEEFLSRLQAIGYAGACSIECRWADMAAELPGAVARLRAAAAAAGWQVE